MAYKVSKKGSIGKHLTIRWQLKGPDDEWVEKMSALGYVYENRFLHKTMGTTPSQIWVYLMVTHDKVLVLIGLESAGVHTHYDRESCNPTIREQLAHFSVS